MVTGTDYEKIYEQAKQAYLQGNFEEAAVIIEDIAEKFPEQFSQDPAVLLLQGHVNCYGLHQYQEARQNYEAVLQLSDEEDIVTFANNGLEQIEQWENAAADNSLQTQGTSAGLQEAEGNVTEADLEISSDQSIDNPFTDDFEMPSEDTSGEPFAFEDTPTNSANPFEDASESENSASWQDSASQNSENDLFIEVDSVESAEEQEQFLESEDPTFIVASESSSTRSTEPDELELHRQDHSDEIDSAAFETEDPSFGQNLIEDVEVFQEDLEDISSFISDGQHNLPDSQIFSNQTGQLNKSENDSGSLEPENSADLSSELEQYGADDEMNSALSHQKSLSSYGVKPAVEVKQGSLSFFQNAPLGKKAWLMAGFAGISSAIAVAVVGLSASILDPDDHQKTSPFSPTGALMSLVAGAASFGTTLALGKLTFGQIKRTTDDLQIQFDSVYQGNLDVQATVYSEDELGQLAAGFNNVSREILTTTKEAQRRAEETEQAREDLQRQVIRLLDDVEGAARGDLTVQAEVTADVLGAVADAFNLTIQNLREIVEQVKQAAQQVNKGSTGSEVFARNQSSDALRMAEELAVTLNSVQMMTDSIQRVAENAREAEEVARSSSATALKGGEAVERTVSGILQIRETVSETARKVKRLAEASQEISKIVALISQIASRTNLLALNASIQAARAGESGKGFAIVADEVRQLADRAAKALKEIEQIVLQIQSETGSVMTAMEEGIQQVIDVTDRAEQAKTSLDDIIEVSNHIDALVRSITADTVEQRENSRAVAQVMQSVELTAQETSQESQRVAGSLQNLVGISQELLASVERFRVNKGEE